MTTIQAREIAARLARIEDAMTTLPAKLRTVRDSYDIVAANHHTLKTMLLMQPTSPARETLLLYMDMMLRNLYALADTLCSLTKLELAASDYAVLMALLGGMVDDETPPALELVQLPSNDDKERSA